MPAVSVDASAASVCKEAFGLPAAPGRTVFICLIALAGGIGFARWLEHRSCDIHTGHLAAQKVTIVAHVDGRIERLVAGAGERIEKGQEVVTLSNDQLETRFSECEHELAELQAELQQAQAKVQVELTWRSKNLDSEIFDTRLQLAECLQEKFTQNLTMLAWQDIAMDEEYISSTQSNTEIFRSLFDEREKPDEQRITAMLRQEAARNAVEVYAAQIELCEKRLDSLSTIKSNLPDQLRHAMGVDVAESRLQQKTTELEQLDRQRRQLALRTTALGTVGVFQYQPGDHVSVGAPIVEILDHDQLYLEVAIPSKQVSSVTAGQEVELMFPGRQRRTGIIKEIPPQTMACSHEMAAQGEDSLVLVQVTPCGKLWPELPIGSAVEVIVPK